MYTALEIGFSQEMQISCWASAKLPVNMKIAAAQRAIRFFTAAMHLPSNCLLHNSRNIRYFCGMSDPCGCRYRTVFGAGRRSFFLGRLF